MHPPELGLRYGPRKAGLLLSGFSKSAGSRHQKKAVCHVDQNAWDKIDCDDGADILDWRHGGVRANQRRRIIGRGKFDDSGGSDWSSPAASRSDAVGENSE